MTAPKFPLATNVVLNVLYIGFAVLASIQLTGWLSVVGWVVAALMTWGEIVILNNVSKALSRAAQIKAAK